MNPKILPLLLELHQRFIELRIASDDPGWVMGQDLADALVKMDKGALLTVEDLLQPDGTPILRVALTQNNPTIIDVLYVLPCNP